MKVISLSAKELAVLRRIYRWNGAYHIGQFGLPDASVEITLLLRGLLRTAIPGRIYLKRKFPFVDGYVRHTFWLFTTYRAVVALRQSGALEAL